MIFIEKLLSDATVKHILNFYEFCEFRDGSSTGSSDRNVKYNLEIHDENHQPALEKFFIEEVSKNEKIKCFLFPKKYSSPLFLKYDENMHYSFHNDYFHACGAKTHYSVTVFLSDPSEYEGGELIIRVGDQEISYKESPGTAIIYPTGLWHTINNITSGCRKVVVFWFQSCIDDPLVRDCVSDLSKILYKSIHEPENKIPNSQYIAIENVKYKLLRVYGNFD